QAQSVLIYDSVYTLVAGRPYCFSRIASRSPVTHSQEQLYNEALKEERGDLLYSTQQFGGKVLAQALISTFQGLFGSLSARFSLSRFCFISSLSRTELNEFRESLKILDRYSLWRIAQNISSSLGNLKVSASLRVESASLL